MFVSADAIRALQESKEEISPLKELQHAWIKAEQSAYDAWVNYRELQEKANKAKHRFADAELEERKQKEIK